MTNQNEAIPADAPPAASIPSIINVMMQVITNPVEFYRKMPKTGGYKDPVIFLAAMAVISSVIQFVFSFFTSASGPFIARLGFLVIFPVMAIIAGFIGAAILFVIWKVLGSNENYETAYRCGAYFSAISPITAVLGLIPYLGALLTLGWSLYLVVTASIEVHKIKAQTAWLTFGIIAGLMFLVSSCAQYTASRVGDMAQDYNGNIQSIIPDGMKKEIQKAIDDQ